MRTPGRMWLPLLAAATAFLLHGCAAPEPGRRVDTLIVGGTLYDGVSEEARNVDVGIRGDRIVFVGSAAAERIGADRVVDASGFVVTPGFIDPHTHSGDDLASDEPEHRLALNHLMQGVTTVFFGNDGGGPVDIGERLESLAGRGIGVNVAAFVGFGTVRRQVVGEADRAPSDEELSEMRRRVANAMCEGALGLSAGLYYAPQSFARTEEVIELARQAAAQGGLFEIHLRDEGGGEFGLLPSVDEAIRIGRSAGLPVHIAHIKALGVGSHGLSSDVIDRIEEARRTGLRVTADQYPWNASGTRLTSALLPGWALAGGRDALRDRLADDGQRRRVLADMRENLRRRGGAGAILITGGNEAGMRLDALASGRGVEAAETALQVIVAEGDAPIASFNMSDEDIDRFAARDWVVASSDASNGHPRRYGSFARRWTRFGQSGPRLGAGRLVRNASGRTAEIFGLEGRGRIEPGTFADLVLLDPVRFRESADYAQPERLAEGVEMVFVNGVAAVDAGRPTGRFAGRSIRRAGHERRCPR